MRFMNILPILVGREIGKMREPDADVVHELLRVLLGDPPRVEDVEALACGFLDETTKAYIRDEQKAMALKLFDETGKEADHKLVRKMTQQKLGLEV